METPLDADEILRYRRRLLDELALLASAVEAVERRALEPSGARSQDVDESIEEAGLAADLDALAAEDALGYELNEALQRIDRGTFGRCEGCGEWIEPQRLDLVPHARQCAPCARQPSPRTERSR